MRTKISRWMTPSLIATSLSGVHVECKIEKLLMSGCGQDRAARICNVGKSVVGRIAREIKQNGAAASTTG